MCLGSGEGESEEENMEMNYSMYKWDHSVNLIGRPVKDPLLHLCEQCTLPVLIYGRMVPFYYLFFFLHKL